MNGKGAPLKQSFVFRFGLMVVVVSAAMLSSGPPAVAEEFKSMLLDASSIGLLGDRLRIQMPKGARIEQRAASVMGATEAVELETRVVFDDGERRLVMMSYELLSMAGAEFETMIRGQAEKASVGGQSVKVARIRSKEGLKVYVEESLPIDPTQESILMSSAWVISPDGTLQLLRAYANPAAARDLVGMQNLLSRVWKSLTKGDRKLSTQARRVTLEVMMPSKRLTLDLPEGYVAVAQKGPDFIVHRISKIVPYGSKVPSLGIYIGAHPSYPMESATDSTPVSEEGGVIAGTRVTWRAISNPPGKFLEALRPAPELHASLAIHVFIWSPNDQDLAALKKAAEEIHFPH